MVLHQSRIRASQKAALGVFLCLSLVMVIFSITRVSKISGASGVDVPWVFFWQFMEASVAVLMGSLTVFRTLLIAEGNKRRAAAAPVSPPGGGLLKGDGSPRRPRSYYALGHRVRLFGRKKEMEEDLEEGLPEIPGALMTGLRTFIRRNHRDDGLKTEISQHSTLAEEEDSIHKVKEKDVKEEVRQVTGLLEPRGPPIAYHYPVSAWTRPIVRERGLTQCWLADLETAARGAAADSREHEPGHGVDGSVDTLLPDEHWGRHAARAEGIIDAGPTIAEERRLKARVWFCGRYGS